MIRIGILGCGKIAQVRHIPEYAANPDCELAAFYNPTRKRAEDMAAKYGGRVYDTPEALLAAAEIDAVSVCAANYAHAELAIKAMRAGKDVLCEKPMAVTPEDCEAMVKTARETGRTLMIAHNQRFAKAHVKAKALIDAGTIGRIVTFRTTFGHGGEMGKVITFETKFEHPGPEGWTGVKDSWFFDKKIASFGVMADLGVHKTDLIHYLTGERVVRTTARVATLDKRGENGALIGVDDNAMCIYEMTGGIVGTMTASWTFYGAEDNSTVLYGTKGIMKIYDDPAHSIVVTLADGTRELYDVERIQTNDNQTKSGVIDAWIDCLKNRTAPAVTGEDALYAMRAVFASLRSSELGAAVEIPENK